MPLKTDYDEIAEFIEQHISGLDTNQDGRLNEAELRGAVQQTFRDDDALIVAFLHGCYRQLQKADLLLNRSDRKKVEAITRGGLNADSFRKIGAVLDENKAMISVAAARMPGLMLQIFGGAALGAHDKDNDHELSKTELKEAIENKAGDEFDKRLLMYIANEFDTISGGDDKISWNELWSHFGQAEVQAQFLIQASQAILRIMQNRAHYETRALFAEQKNAHEIEAIQPHAIRQGFAHDCLFLAMTASVAALNPWTIYKSIKPLGGNPRKFEVRFPMAPDEPFIVPAPSETELILYCAATQYGIWPAILEKACAQYCLKSVKRRLAWLRPWFLKPLFGSKDETYNATFGGWSLYGETQRLSTPSSIDEFSKVLREQIEGKRACTLASIFCKKRDKRIHGNHAYALVNYEPLYHKVTVYNPWGRSCTMDASETDNTDGFIELTLQEAFDTFSVIYRITEMKQ